MGIGQRKLGSRFILIRKRNYFSPSEESVVFHVIRIIPQLRQSEIKSSEIQLLHLNGQANKIFRFPRLGL
jgi:hypothetical protein